MITGVKVNGKKQYVFDAPTFNSADIAQQYPSLRKGVDAGLYLDIMKIFGDCILERLKDEITRLMGLHVLPRSNNLYNSFGYVLSPQMGYLSFYSTWDKASIYVPGRETYKMTWLTKQKGANRKIPMKDKNGKLVFRSVPLTTNKAWVHPGIQKFSFFNKAIEQGRWYAASKVVDFLMLKEVI